MSTDVKQFPKGKPVIQISGFSKSEKRSLTEKIEGLGATYYPQVQFHEDCEVLVLKKLNKSEKFLCALATGTPVVGRKYIEDSVKLGKWQNIYHYIYKPKDEEVVKNNLSMAPISSLSKTEGRRRAFSHWTCAVQVSAESSQAVYKRILGVGGAKIVDLHLEDVTSGRNVPHNLMYFFTEKCFRGRSLNIVAGNGVHCVTADYMGDFLIMKMKLRVFNIIEWFTALSLLVAVGLAKALALQYARGRVSGKTAKHEEPQPRHYVVPYCPVVDLTISPLKSEHSIINLSDKWSDSDVEVVSSSSPLNIRQPREMNTPVRDLQLGNALHSPFTNTVISAQPTSSVSTQLPTRDSKPNINNNNGEVKGRIKTEAVYEPITPVASLTDVYNARPTSGNIGKEVNGYTPTTVGTNNAYSPSQERLTKPSSKTTKKYPKMLVITPVKRSFTESNSQGSQSNLGKTPTKVDKMCGSSRQLATPPRLISTPKSSPATPKTPVMPENALLKYFTVSPRTSQNVPPVPKSVKPLSDRLNLRPLVDDPESQQMSAVTSTADLPSTTRVVEERSCLGLLDHLTSRFTIEQREQMYNIHQQFEIAPSKPAVEDINLTNEFPHKELQEIPVLLCKQIHTYFEDERIESHLNGLELLSLCHSNHNYPPVYLLRQIYHILLTTTDKRVACAAHKYLIGRLEVNAPDLRLCEDVETNAKKLCETRRMRMVYMASLVGKNHCNRRIYLRTLNMAAETLAKGGLSVDSKPETNNTPDTDTDGEDEELSSHGGDNSQGTAPDEEKDGCLGSRLFLDYLCNLLLADFRTARSPNRSMLYDICKGNFFAVNLVDNEDTRSLLDLSKQLMGRKEIELMCKVLEVVGLLGELCAPNCMIGNEHSLSVIVRHLSTIISDCSLADADNMLTHILPPWLSYKVLEHLLEDKSMYSSDLVRSSVTSFPHPSLQRLLSKYMFLVPSESYISSICSAVTTSQSLHTRKKKTNYKGETALHTACIKGDVEKVKQLLLEPDTSVNAADHAGWTPLHEACNHGHKHVVELLLNHKSPHFHFDGGGKVDLLMKAGEDDITPLQDAVRVNQIEIVKLLLKYGGHELADAEAKLGVAISMATTDEMERILGDAIIPSAVEGIDESSNDLSSTTQLRIATPSIDIYSSHVCSTDEEVVERYVTYCLQMVSLYLAAFPLTATDKDILNRLSSHLDPFVKHVMWLRSSDEEPPAYLWDGLRTLLLLSV